MPTLCQVTFSQIAKKIRLSELKFAKLLGAFGVSQLVQLLSSTLRIPVIAGTTSLGVLSLTFLWLNLQAWGSVLSAGDINVARIQSQRGNSLKRNSRAIVTARWTSALVSVSTLTLGQWTYCPAWLGGLGPTMICFIVATTFSKNLGYLQGKGVVAKQFIATAAGSVIGLLATVLVTTSAFWSRISPFGQVYWLATISALTYSSPFLYAWFLTRKKIVWIAGDQELKKPRWDGVIELASVLPPAFVSGFDSVALALAGNQTAIAEYGLLTRVGLMASMVSSALYVQINNVAGARLNQKKSDMVRDSTRLLVLTAPFALVFLFSAPTIVDLLSNGLVEASPNATAAMFLLSLVLPIWIACSANIMANDSSRRKMGHTVLALLVPVSAALTLVLARYLGAAGPFYASFATYILAIIAAVVISRGQPNFSMQEIDK